MKKIMIKALIIIAIILVLLLCAAIIILPGMVMTGSRQTLDEARAWQSERIDISYYDDLEKTDYIVKGYKDYELHTQFLKNPTVTDKYIILSHGYTDNRIGSLKYAKMYLDLGFNCIIYDLRGHGLNENTFTTYGIREAEDLMAIIKDTRDRYDNIAKLGIHGESLGAATSITALKYKPDIDFVVADCGFADIYGVLYDGYKSAHMPTFLLKLASIGAKIRYGYSLKDMRPIDSLPDNEIPICFIHGAADNFILPKNSEQMASASKGYTELHLIDGAAHAYSIFTDPVKYREYVEGFLNRISN
ncbi:MAG: alpha/beta hydrolase [Lachnospiraceae bacterium]|nr:alpha/beta hydrolase [Lachnospiraceae bacterium]